MIQPFQLSLEEFYEEDKTHEGLEYKVEGSGNVEADPEQLSLDEMAEKEIEKEVKQL